MATPGSYIAGIDPKSASYVGPYDPWKHIVVYPGCLARQVHESVVRDLDDEMVGVMLIDKVCTVIAVVDRHGGPYAMFVWYDKIVFVPALSLVPCM